MVVVAVVVEEWVQLGRQGSSIWGNPGIIGHSEILIRREGGGRVCVYACMYV